jgi:hypothetical protein
LKNETQPSESIEGEVAPARQKGAHASPDRSRSQRKSIMHYLGGISGSGVIKCDGEGVARATYDFDGFFHKTTGVTGSGEIRLSAAVLKNLFGRKNVQLFTDDGRLLDLKFSERTLPSASEAAHVDVTGDLPNPRSWRR